ncbi:class I SAM-dependent methyltransferase [soil metagenome]
MPGATPGGSGSLYDVIGVGYAGVRTPDPRIEARLHAELGGAWRVLNVGAGAGSYEPTDRSVTAVEPSLAMLGQRPIGAATAVRAVADRLPFPDRGFDAAMALLTVHHWPDPAAGLTELRRVTTGPVVVLTFDKAVHEQQWLVTDYLPAMAGLDVGHLSPAEIVNALRGGSVEIMSVPADCADGFCHAWWRRPEAYLDPIVRAAISGIARLPKRDVADAMDRLRADLDDGSWQRRHRDLLERTEIDAGYRIVTSPGTS